MIYNIYPIKTTTLYEAEKSQNTGQDQVLEIEKIQSGSNFYNSRVLLKFKTTDITTLTTSSLYYLKLYETEASEIPIEYTVYCYAASQSWDRGTGRKHDEPITTNGTSWYYRDSKKVGTYWLTGS